MQRVAGATDAQLREQAARDEATKKSIEADLEWVEFFYTAVSRKAFLDNLYVIKLGRDHQIKLEKSPTGGNNIGSGRQTIGPLQYEEFGLRDRKGVTIIAKPDGKGNVSVWADPEPDPNKFSFKKDRAEIFKQIIGVTVLKGFSSINYEIREFSKTDKPFDNASADRFIEELNAFMDAAENFKDVHGNPIPIPVNFVGRTLEGLKPPKMPPDKLINGKSPELYFEERQQRIIEKRYLNRKYRELIDKKVQNNSSEAKTMTTAMPTAAKKTFISGDVAYLNSIKGDLETQTNAKLAGSDKQAKAEKANTEVKGIANRMAKLEKSFNTMSKQLSSLTNLLSEDGIIERLLRETPGKDKEKEKARIANLKAKQPPTEYNKLIQDERKKNWKEVEKAYKDGNQSLNETDLHKTLVGLAAEQNEMSLQLEAYKNVWKNTKYDNADVSAAPVTLEQKYNQLTTQKAAGATLNADDQAALKSLEEMKSKLTEAETSLNKVKTQGLKDNLEQLDTGIQQLKAAAQAQAPGQRNP